VKKEFFELKTFIEGTNPKINQFRGGVQTDTF